MSRKTLGFYFECYHKGGFSQLDLWHCMYEEASNYVNEELIHERIIEVIKYNARDKIVSIQTGS